MSKRSLLTEWDAYLERFPPALLDIYFTERYARLYEAPNGQAQAFLFEDGGHTFLLPFLRGPIGVLGAGFAAFETAYGYGGPLSTTTDPAFIDSACTALEEFAAESGLIAGFIRFHPPIGNATWVADRWPVVLDRTTVAVDLTLSEEEMLRSMHRSFRNRLRKAETAGLSFAIDSAFERMDDFVRLYKLTMDRVKAAPAYYFGAEYFDAIRRNLAGDSFLGLVLLGDTVAAAGLFLRMGDYGHAHLAASDTELRSEGANNLLFYGGSLALKDMGARLMHLGGGRTNSPDDDLLRFKQNCASLVYEFYRAQLVTRQDDYLRACAEWDSGPGRLPEMAPYSKHFLRFLYQEAPGTPLRDKEDRLSPGVGSKPRVILLGGGGHARSLLDILLEDNGISILGLLDLETSPMGSSVEGVPVLGGDHLLHEMSGRGATHFLVAIGGTGANEPRRRLFQKGREGGLRPLTISHSSAIISPRATLGEGCQIMAGCIINSGASLGVNVLINTGAIVEHDCVIGDHVHVATGAMLAGGVRVAELAHIGAGAVIKQCISVGARAIVGAGSVVVRDVPAGMVVAGVPARALRSMDHKGP